MDSSALLAFGLVFLFVLIGGVFAGTEMAIVSLRDSQIREIEESGERGRRTAALARDPNQFLSAVQIGVTVAGFFSSAYGASTIAPALAPAVQRLGVSAGAASTIALIGMTLVIAYLSLVFGELVPKRLAMQNAKAMTRILGPILGVFSVLMRPVIWLLSTSTDIVVRLLGGDPHANREEVSAEEIRSMVRDSDAIAGFESRVLTDVFDAAERTVVEVMRPRRDMHVLPATASAAEAREALRGTTFSRYPVTGMDIDDVTGFVHVRDLLHVEDPSMPLSAIARPILQLPGTVGALDALNRMRAERDHIAVVVDEYGGTDGLVTLEDLLEELVGEIYDEYDAEVRSPGAAHTAGAPLDLDGGLIVQEFGDRTGVELPDGRGYETVAGFVMAQLRRVPAIGDSVDIDGGRLEVREMDGHRVTRLRFTPDGAGSDADDADYAGIDPAAIAADGAADSAASGSSRLPATSKETRA
ncbi:hemolysin family protein [Brachybacterium sp. JHP9]|uniref:Hemolysin family protein n=1 Tax=Brachybacterium equifaecis TaxID=2910770 RepID=A0ABT0QY55_9MICO|nr:hemolysin family protein [Brachybacterium equifaecis]MCL6422133.1 hemolysin family protein [Brachybacterium equifaecis]